MGMTTAARAVLDAARAVLEAVREDRLTPQLQRAYRLECARISADEADETTVDELVRERAPETDARRPIVAEREGTPASNLLRDRGLSEEADIYESGYRAGVRSAARPVGPGRKEWER